MHFLFLLATASIGLVVSLSLPLDPLVLRLPSVANGSVSDQPVSITTNLTSGEWPDPSDQIEISEKKSRGVLIEATYMTIGEYQTPIAEIPKGLVPNNISLIIQLIDGYEPDNFIDNRRVFKSGLVSVRFPAVQTSNNVQRITNSIAVELLSATWQLQYAYQPYGPRGWDLAKVEAVRFRDGRAVGRSAVGFFSLWIEDGGANIGTAL